MATSVEDLYKKYKIDPKQYMSKMILGEYATIPISPAIDATCGGGIREGSLAIIAGKEKLGKSALCLQIAANAQCIDDGKTRRIYYLDIENKLQQRDLTGIRNLDTSKNFEVVGSSQLGIVAAESYFNIAENIVTNNHNSIIIFDSLSMLLTKDELAYNFDDGQKRPDVPKYTSIFCKKMRQLLRPTKSIMLAINHVYVSQGIGPATLQESGGKKVQYAGDYNFRLVFKTPVEKDGVIIGNQVTFQCLYHPSDSTTSPKEKCEFFHRFQYGIDDVNDIIELSILYAIIEKKGSWLSYGEHKWQGKENAREAIVNDKALLNDLRLKVQELTT